MSPVYSRPLAHSRLLQPVASRTTFVGLRMGLVFRPLLTLVQSELSRSFPLIWHLAGLGSKTTVSIMQENQYDQLQMSLKALTSVIEN